MLFTLQRYEFFSKSQQLVRTTEEEDWCCLPYKGTNFSANHNSFPSQKADRRDVVYPTKVRIFQQITTNTFQRSGASLMLFTLQRYEFFSKSQLYIVKVSDSMRCCLPYKGTNFSANHNYEDRWSTPKDDVVYPTKVRIFQQITTQFSICICTLKMLFTLQRYEFFSKSQLVSYFTESLSWCCLPYKGTNFSANHNSSYQWNNKNFDVVYPTKVRIFQQITTSTGVGVSFTLMLFTLQRYEFFSKSQQERMRICRRLDVVYPTKVRIFQQITTASATYLSNI